LYYMVYDINVHLKQLEVLINELNFVLDPNNKTLDSLMALIIYREPFPDIINKTQQLGTDVLIVKLLVPSSIVIHSTTEVTAHMLVNSGKEKKLNPLLYENQTINSTTLEVSFPLKFEQGTLKTPVCLHFSMGLTISILNSPLYSITLQSSRSSPFIVTTNESNQYVEAEGVILKKDAFQGNNEVTWISFCNTLQRHLFRATRQDTTIAYRNLSISDFGYIYQRFFQQTVVTQERFKQFWKWFGEILHTMRHSKYISKIWQTGLINGFLSRTDVESALLNHKPGTFIIRFSERAAGRFAIGYVSVNNDGIKHYLVKNTDVNPKRSLADFICDCALFRYVLLLTSYDQQNKPVYQPAPKIELFEQYKSPSLRTDLFQGYEPLETPYSSLSREKFKPNMKIIKDEELET